MDIAIGLIREYLLILYRTVQSIFLIRPPAAWQQGTRGDILLLPGWNETWTFGLWLCSRLNSLGFRIHTLPALGRNWLTIANSVAVVDRYIADHNLKNIQLVCHSKGCVIATAYLKSYPTAPVAQVFCIAGAFGGSRLAWLPFPGLRELAPSSPLIRQLTHHFDVSRFVNIFPAFDNHVLPNSGLILSGAKNHRLPVIGHTVILESPLTLQIIADHLSPKQSASHRQN